MYNFDDMYSEATGYVERSVRELVDTTKVALIIEESQENPHTKYFDTSSVYHNRQNDHLEYNLYEYVDFSMKVDYGYYDGTENSADKYGIPVFMHYLKAVMTECPKGTFTLEERVEQMVCTQLEEIFNDKSQRTCEPVHIVFNFGENDFTMKVLLRTPLKQQVPCPCFPPYVSCK